MSLALYVVVAVDEANSRHIRRNITGLVAFYDRQTMASACVPVDKKNGEQRHT